MHGLSGASMVPPTQDPALAGMRSLVKQRTQDFRDLRNALRAGDLAGAQTAFNTLQQEIQKASAASGGKSPFDPKGTIGKDFQALAEALKGGNLDAAQSAFKTLRQDLRAARHAANHFGSGGSQSSPPATGPGSGGLDATA
ncbi:MAG TPA: hypothetical protein DCM86_07940 [Verrucomicrobiales bacterium]|nr:hypothetical protein [Verrucomicrobiales bacterium]